MQSPPAPNITVHRGADSHEIRALTGIRGVAAFWVVIFHFFPYWVQLFPPLAIIKLPASRGYMGVDLFFMLSGFILSYVYASGDLKFGFVEYGRFIWFRIARIFPNHLATLVFLVVLTTFSRIFHLHVNQPGPYSHLPFHATLTQIWPFVPRNQTLEWVGTAWSLSAEWFAYIFIFPLLAYVHRRKWHPLPCFILSYTLLIWVFSDLSYIPINGLLLNAICKFLAGGFIFAVYLHSSKFTRVCRQYVSVFALVLIGIVAFVSFSGLLQTMVISFLMPPLLVGLTTELSWIGWILSTPVILWSGRISYAIYITHSVAMHVLKIILPWPHFLHSSLPVRLSVILGHMALILIFAIVLHYAVEIPARNYMRKKRPW